MLEFYTTGGLKFEFPYRFTEVQYCSHSESFIVSEIMEHETTILASLHAEIAKLLVVVLEELFAETRKARTEALTIACTRALTSSAECSEAHKESPAELTEAHTESLTEARKKSLDELDEARTIALAELAEEGTTNKESTKHEVPANLESLAAHLAVVTRCLLNLLF